MSHLDPDQLALLAMGEPVASPEDADHLAGCAICADELATFRHTALVGRSAIDAGELESPPESVWTRVSDELGLRTPADAASAAPHQQAEQISDPAVESAGPVPRHATRAEGRRSRPARRRAGIAWALAASMVIVAGVGIGTWVATRPPAVVEVAQASLDAFPEHPGAEGSAVVEEDADGALVVRVSVEADATPDTYREVWLITGDASALISLGVLAGTEGTFSIPDGVDIRDYVLVDVSQEPIDGKPGHSGDSIVRGELAFA